MPYFKVKEFVRCLMIPRWAPDQPLNVVTNVMQEWLLSNPNPDKPELTNDEFLFCRYWPILEPSS